MPLLRHERGRARERCSPVRPAFRRYKSRCRLFSIIYGLNLTTSTAVLTRRHRHATPPRRTLIRTQRRPQVPIRKLYVIIHSWWCAAEEYYCERVLDAECGQGYDARYIIIWLWWLEKAKRRVLFYFNSIKWFVYTHSALYRYINSI